MKNSIEYVQGWLFDQCPREFYEQAFTPFWKIYSRYQEEHPDCELSPRELGKILNVSGYRRVKIDGMPCYSMLREGLMLFDDWLRSVKMFPGDEDDGVWVSLSDLYVWYVGEQESVKLSMKSCGRMMRRDGFKSRRTQLGVQYWCSNGVPDYEA